MRTVFYLCSSRTRDYTLAESTIEVTIKDVFSPVNGSVHLFTLIVVERNEFIHDYENGDLPPNLTTWARVCDVGLLCYC